MRRIIYSLMRSSHLCIFVMPLWLSAMMLGVEITCSEKTGDPPPPPPPPPPSCPPPCKTTLYLPGCGFNSTDYLYFRGFTRHGGGKIQLPAMSDDPVTQPHAFGNGTLVYEVKCGLPNPNPPPAYQGSYTDGDIFFERKNDPNCPAGQTGWYWLQCNLTSSECNKELAPSCPQGTDPLCH